MPYYPDQKRTGPEEDRQSKGTEKRKKLLRLSAVVFFAILFLYGSVRLVSYLAELNASRDTAGELRRIRDKGEAGSADGSEAPARTETPSEPEGEEKTPARTAAQTPTATVTPAAQTSGQSDAGTKEDLLPPVPYPDNPGLRFSDRFRQLRKKGQYIIGWLSFDQVDEAVVQKDNSYFLTHDATGKKNSNGAIFLDAGTSILTRPYTLILYGHNMKSGNMFGRLKKYRESAYFYQNRIISFDTIYEEGRFAVFAVMEMETVPGLAKWFDLWSLDSRSRKTREEAIRKMIKRSVIGCSLNVRADDQLLLLVTCMDGETERLVVAARRLRDGESEDSLRLSAMN